MSSSSMKNLIKYACLFLFFTSIIACSSKGLRFKERVVEEGEEKYTVVDGASDQRPTWLDKPQEASLKLAGVDKENLYFSFESGPKISQEIACNIVRVYARDDLAKRMVDFYLDDRDLGSSIDLNWRLLIASEGSRVFKNTFKSSKIISSYWERRLYPPKVGDTEEIEGYSCALWIEVSKELFNQSLLELAELGKKRFWQTPGWEQLVKKKSEIYRGFHEETY